MKQEKERQDAADGKAGKRLNKKPPPPAAMDTQKIPPTLRNSRRNSWMSIISSGQPASGDESRRSSRDEKRSSGISLSSFKSKRSSSTPGTSTDSAPDTGTSEPWRSVVSPSAPKLPSFKWGSSRRNSTDTSKPPSRESDHACEKDLIAFAYRLDSSTTIKETQQGDQPDSMQNKRAGSPQKSSGSPALSKSSTEQSFKSVPYESTSSRSPPRSPEKPKSDSPQNTKEIKPRKSCSEEPSPSIATNTRQSSPPMPQAPSGASHDGSSYVHKQRMYQQQQYIAGFEDQQALMDANELANGLVAGNQALSGKESNPSADANADVERGRSTESSTPVQSSSPTKASSPKKASKSHNRSGSESSIYTKQRNRSLSPHIKPPPPKHQSVRPSPLSKDATQEIEPVDQRQPEQDSPQESVVRSKPQIPGDSRSRGILGFRRRSKQPPTLTAVPYGAETHVKAIQSAPPDTTVNKKSALKPSKLEPTLKDTTSVLADHDHRRSLSPARDRVQDIMTGSKSAKSHSRTRTSSSTVLNENTASRMPMPMPKSKTEPTLNKKNKSTDKIAHTKKEANRTKAVQQVAVRPQFSFETEPEEMIRKSKDTVAGSKARDKNESTITTSTKTNVSKDQVPENPEKKLVKKQPHEVIGKSETGEGLIRKTSITRPRSNPQLQIQNTPSNPAIDFLPTLKHQPLVKMDRTSPTRSSPTTTSPISISQFQEPITSLSYESPSPPDLKLLPRSPLRTPSQFPVPVTNRFNRSSTDIGTVSFGKGALSAEGADAKPIAKLFVICCKCKFWHDLPSKLYEAVALPLELHKAEKGKVAGARLETAVKCPWCDHAMTTSCCQGWTTVVYMHERHH